MRSEGYDARKRQRERKAAAEAAAGVVDPKVGAKLLLERERSGELSIGRLQLAAHLGDTRARLALEQEAFKSSEILNGDMFEDWVRGIDEINTLSEAVRIDVMLRVSIALARKVLPIFENSMLDDERPRKVIEAVEEWVFTDEKSRNADDMNIAIHSASLAAHASRNNYSASEAASSAGAAAHGAFRPRDAALRAADAAGSAIIAAIYADDSTVPYAVKAAAEMLKLHGAIRDELVPWVLGEGSDPVRERVDARKKEEE